MYMIFDLLLIIGGNSEEEVQWEKERGGMAAAMTRKEAAEVSGTDQARSTPVKARLNEVEMVKCECCGLTEECTLAYIARVKERNQGRWICGLCTEAVNDEMMRSGRRIESEEAMNRHMNFCRKFRNLRPPQNPTEVLISAVKQLMLRSLDSPRSCPVTRQGFVRSQSCNR